MDVSNAATDNGDSLLRNDNLSARPMRSFGLSGEGSGGENGKPSLQAQLLGRGSKSREMGAGLEAGFMTLARSEFSWGGMCGRRGKEAREMNNAEV